MARMITITVDDLALLNCDTEDERVKYALETVGEFASDVGAEVDVEFHDCTLTEVMVDVSGADEDVALFSRRWHEE